jgi:hypothetical protein
MTVGKVREIHNHARVLVGYCDAVSQQWVLLYDPWYGPQLQTYDSWVPDSTSVWPPFASWNPVRVKRDEATVWTDSDGDGIMDFDEVQRGFTGSSQPDCQAPVPYPSPTPTRTTPP